MVYKHNFLNNLITILTNTYNILILNNNWIMYNDYVNAIYKGTSAHQPKMVYIIYYVLSITIFLI